MRVAKTVQGFLLGGSLVAGLLATGELSAQAIAGTVTGNYPPGAVFSALERAYPGWVRSYDPLGGPAVTVDGHVFAWAEGRILPLEQQGDWSSYSPQPFYEYPATEPDVGGWSASALATAEARLADRRAQVLRRSPALFDTLWGVHDRGSADSHQRRIRFLGLPVTVHVTLVQPLKRVEARLVTAAAADASLDSFLGSLIRLEGYNWRPIAETKSRSNHSYGAALDLIPSSYRGKNPYWLWAPQESPGWYRKAWAARWKPHPSVVKAFEAEGFIWGGKWLLFDTIHFEYRPEILVLNGLR